MRNFFHPTGFTEHSIFVPRGQRALQGPAEIPRRYSSSLPPLFVSGRFAVLFYTGVGV